MKKSRKNENPKIKVIKTKFWRKKKENSSEKKKGKCCVGST